MSVHAPLVPRRRHMAVAAAFIAGSSILAGCGGGGDDGGGSGSAAEGGGTILFDFPYTAEPIYTVTLEIAQQRAADAGYELTTTDDQASQDLQISNLTAQINGGVDAIVTFPIEPSTMTSLVQSAHDAGVSWTSYGTSVEGEDALIDLSGYETGMAQAQAYATWAETHLDDAGTVLVEGTDIAELGRQRTQGMLDGLAEYAPDATIVQANAFGTQEGIDVTRAEMTRNPDIDGILALTDDTAVGAATALQELGASAETTFVAGNDGSPVVLQQIKDGTGYVDATIAIDIPALANAIVDVSAALITGEATDGYKAEPIILTQDSPELDDLIAVYN